MSRKRRDVYAAGVLAPSAIDSHIVNTNLLRKERRHNTTNRRSSEITKEKQSQSRKGKHEIEILNFYWLTASQNDASTIEFK